MAELVAAAPADRSAIVELLRSCALPTEDLPPALDQFFVARAGGAIVGVVGLERFEGLGLVRSLAVAGERRGQGLARELWGLALARARALGLRELFLLTATAEAIFAHWGFARIPRAEAPEPIKQTEEFRTLCSSSAAVMRLALEGDGEFLRPSDRPSV